MAVLSALLLAPALGAGWQFDDHFHRSRIAGYGDANPIQIFVPYDGIREHNLAQMEAGTLPWWASPNLHLAFLRYTSTLTMLLDYWLWPMRPAVMHLHSLRWLSFAVGAAAVLYRRVFGATWVAGLAALLDAVDEAHAWPATYLANRNALIATALGIASLICFIRWREGWRWGRSLSVLLLALALSAGEMALATAGYLFAFAVSLDHGRLWERLSRLAPEAVVVALWAAIYKLGGFGSHGSGFYIDPLGAPLNFGSLLLDRARWLLLGQWTPIPAEMGLIYAGASQKASALRAISLAVVVLLMALFLPLVRRDRFARFWALGVVLALLPVAAVGPENRVLFFVGLGSMALLAHLTRVAFASPPIAPPSAAWRLLARVAIVVLLPIHVLLAPVLALQTLRRESVASAAMLRAVANIPDDPSIVKQDLIIVNPPEHSYVVTAIPVLKELDGLPRPRRIRALSAGTSGLTVMRVDARSLRVDFPASLFPSVFARYMRSDTERFQIGQRFAVSGLTATIEALDGRGDLVRVLYEFAVPIDDASLRWMQWTNGTYVPWRPPPPGESVTLPPTRGIFG